MIHAAVIAFLHRWIKGQSAARGCDRNPFRLKPRFAPGNRSDRGSWRATSRAHCASGQPCSSRSAFFSAVTCCGFTPETRTASRPPGHSPFVRSAAKWATKAPVLTVFLPLDHDVAPAPRTSPTSVLHRRQKINLARVSKQGSEDSGLTQKSMSLVKS